MGSSVKKEWQAQIRGKRNGKSKNRTVVLKDDRVPYFVLREFILCESERNEFRVLFWNINGVKKKLKDRPDKLYEFFNKYDFVGLCETKFKGDLTKKLERRGWRWYASDGKQLKSQSKGGGKARNNPTSGGLAAGVKSPFKFLDRKDMENHRDYQRLWVGYNGHEFLIYNIYNNRHPDETETEYLALSRKPWCHIIDRTGEWTIKYAANSDFVILGGDFNAKTGTQTGTHEPARQSKSEEVDPFGRSLLEVVGRCKLLILNGQQEISGGQGELTRTALRKGKLCSACKKKIEDGKETCERKSCGSVLDYIIISDNYKLAIEKFEVVIENEPNPLKSDHRPVYALIGLHNTECVREKLKREEALRR